MTAADAVRSRNGVLYPLLVCCRAVFGTLELEQNPLQLVDYRLLDAGDVKVVVEGVQADTPSCLGAGTGLQVWGHGATAEVCAACPLGSYCPAGVGVVQLCPNGTYADAVGQHACTKCPPGTWSNATGASQPSACVPCKPGTSSAAAGAATEATCVPCAQASFAPATGMAVCTPCPPRYSGTGVTGATSQHAACEPCPAGTEPAPGSTHCRACQPGSVSNGTRCTPCGAGEFASLAACHVCPRHSFATADQEACAPCADREGVSCYDGVPRIMPGWWLPPPARPANASLWPAVQYASLAEALERNATLYMCQPQSACPSETPGTEVTCEAGSEGVLCGQCAPGWVRTRAECVQCSTDQRFNVGVTIACAVAIVVAVVTTIRSAVNAWRKNSKLKPVIAVLKSLFTFLQFLMLWHEYHVPWPKVVNDMWDASGATSSLPLNSAFVSCATGVSYKQRLFIVLASPWMLLLLMSSIPLGVWAYRRLAGHLPYWKGAVSTFQTAVIMVWFVIYPQVRVSVTRFDCCRCTRVPLPRRHRVLCVRARRRGATHHRGLSDAVSMTLTLCHGVNA